MVAITLGAILGLIIGLVRMRGRLRRNQGLDTSRTTATLQTVSRYLTWITFTVLFIAMAWTTYFLVMGATDPARIDYAQNMSQLIVSVVTVFSIIIAFYQFLTEQRRRDAR